MKKEIICIVCPRGCHILVDGEDGFVSSVDGYGCNRGKNYAENEYSHPHRILTSTVKIAGINHDLLPVRSSKALPKEKLFDCMEVIRKTEVTIPVASHDVIIPNICDTGVDIIASKTVG